MNDPLQEAYSKLEKIKLNGYGNEIIQKAQNELLTDMYLRDGFKTITKCISDSINNIKLGGQTQ